MFNREALENITKVEAKEPSILGLSPKWIIKHKKEAVWAPAKDHEYRISLGRDGWEFHYFAPGARVGERSGPKTVFVHGYKAADAAEADWKERSSKDKTEAAPPGWEGTVKAMKKHPEITNPWALAWSMKNAGAKPHYKLNKRKQPVKTEEGVHVAVSELRAALGEAAKPPEVKPAKLKGKKLEAEINALYYKHADRVQINIMDLGKVAQAGRDANDRGEDMAAAMIAAITKYRTN